MKTLRTLITMIMLAFFAAAPVFVLSGCDKDTGIEDAAEATKDAVEDAADATGDAVEDAADEVKDEF